MSPHNRNTKCSWRFNPILFQVPPAVPHHVKKKPAHPDRDCSPVCSVSFCSVNLKKCRTHHITNFEDDKKRLVKAKFAIEEDSCLCGTCIYRMRRWWKTRIQRADEDTDVPFSLPAKKNNDTPPCFFSSVGKCNAQLKTHMTSVDDWSSFEKAMGIEQHKTQPQVAINLCHRHYSVWYNKCKLGQCTLCSKSLVDWKGRKVSNIPKDEKLRAYLQETGHVAVNLPQDSRICKKCFQYFCKLRRQLNKVPVINETSDSNLREFLQSYERHLASPTNQGRLPLQHAIVFCLNNLLNHKPFLLSDVYIVYRRGVDCSSSHVSSANYLESPSRLLIKLKELIGTHMSHSAVVKEDSLLWRLGDNTADLLLRELQAKQKPLQPSDPDNVTCATCTSCPDCWIDFPAVQVNKEDSSTS